MKVLSIEKITDLITNSSVPGKPFNVAISGGSLPNQISKAIATVDVSLWRVFLVDERYVPLSSPDSNYKQIITIIPSLKDKVVAVNVDASVEEATLEYQDKLKDIVSFDLVLLGIGPDGHTASLFPSHALLNAFINDSPKEPPTRITLTYAVINNAKTVAFVITGAAKAPVVKRIIEGRDLAYPATRVEPKSGNLLFYLDKDASSLLTKEEDTRI